MTVIIEICYRLNRKWAVNEPSELLKVKGVIEEFNRVLGTGPTEMEYIR
jgi:hypothetical protein